MNFVESNIKIKIGIVGGDGITAGELIRILQFHPKIKKINVISRSNFGKNISIIHDDLLYLSEKFIQNLDGDEDLIFLCLSHGLASKYLIENLISKNVKIIDLSNDFRLNSNNYFQNRKFVYGLPELNKELIKKANFIANPGCFATAIQLALLPLAKKHLLKNDIHISAITGSTGAGKELSKSTNFSWRYSNISSYKEFTHQHLEEINQSFKILQPSFNFDIRFIPYRGNFSRGIFSSIYTKFDKKLNDALQLFNLYYKNHFFIKISKNPIHLKQVVGSNFCYLHLIKYKDEILIHSIIDNLVKGASGQAVHNMNLMFGWKEDLGLKFKGIYF